MPRRTIPVPVVVQAFGYNDTERSKAPQPLAIPPQTMTANTNNAVALCVDLDGTLLRTDTLGENLFDVLRDSPSTLTGLLRILLKGKSHLKHYLAESTDFDPATLPWRQDLIAELQRQRAGGRRVVLTTAASHLIAVRISTHLGLFDEVIASTPGDNLRGAAKHDALVRRFGKMGFDYVGDHESDLIVWSSARRAWVVGSTQLADKAKAAGIEVERVFPDRQRPVKALLTALRPYQWVKNVLVFLPLLFAHHFADSARWTQALTAFASLSMLASAGYLINDLLDRRHDRMHVRKRVRPFASGDLPLTWSLAIPILVIAALYLCTFLPVQCLGLALLYFTSTVAYSLILRDRAVVDVALLSCLYSIRIVMGGYATDSPLSFWMIGFSVFVFFSLALAKRVAEIRAWESSGHLHIPGRGYAVSDLAILSSMGVSAGYLSALLLALYIQSAEVVRLYTKPKMLWMILPLLLTWLSRLWLETHRGKMTDDPIVFAFRDLFSLSLGAALVIIAALAL